MSHGVVLTTHGRSRPTGGPVTIFNRQGSRWLNGHLELQRGGRHTRRLADKSHSGDGSGACQSGQTHAGRSTQDAARTVGSNVRPAARPASVRSASVNPINVLCIAALTVTAASPFLPFDSKPARRAGTMAQGAGGDMFCGSHPPAPGHLCGVGQRPARLTHNQEIGGSNPPPAIPSAARPRTLTARGGRAAFPDSRPGASPG